MASGYNWGAEFSINGATAQADILGIFGREGLDLATRWTTPASNTPTYLAMKLYRNYDGHKSAFGDISILTTAPNPDVLAAFGAVRASDGALTLMVINKDIAKSSPFNASLTNFAAGAAAHRWQLTASNAIAHIPDIALTNGILSDLVPSQSITLYVVPAAVAAPFDLRIASPIAPGIISLQLDGQQGLTYALQSSPDLVHWSAFTTNTLLTNSLPFSAPTTNATMTYYRALWLR